MFIHLQTFLSGFWKATSASCTSPLLVLVNSKSGDNQGVKFLRKFKQLLNPAQVFDLMNGGPELGYLTYLLLFLLRYCISMEFVTTGFSANTDAVIMLLFPDFGSASSSLSPHPPVPSHSLLLFPQLAAFPEVCDISDPGVRRRRQRGMGAFGAG